MRLQYIYQSGCDRGRNVVVWLGANTPRQNEERTLMYIVKVLATAAERDFMVFFFVGEDAQPSLSFMKQLVAFFDYAWSPRLLGFYVVHAGFFFKVSMGVVKMLASERFASRLAFLESLRDVHAIVDHAQVKVNDALLAYDRRLNKCVCPLRGARNSRACRSYDYTAPAVAASPVAKPDPEL